MRKVVMGLVAVAFVANFAGTCGTDRSDQVTATSARYKAHAYCHAQRGAHDHGYYRIAYKAKELVNGNFIGAQSWVRFDCPYETTNQPITATVNTLGQNTVYQSRLEIQYDNGVFTWWDGSNTQEGTAYTLTSTDADETGDGAQEYAEGGAIPSVSAEKCLRWRHRTHYGWGSADASRTRGELHRLCSRDITLICEAEINVEQPGGYIDRVSDDDVRFYPNTPCAVLATSAANNGCPHLKACVASTFKFSAILNNVDRRWISRFDKPPNRGCAVFRNESGKSEIECLNHQGLLGSG